MSHLQKSIPALTSDGEGHQFALYGDSCSGVAGARHEKTHASVNAVVASLSPQPEFIIFPGDEIIGLINDEAELKSQWRHWLDVEMAWLDRSAVPLYNSTGNHTTYDEMSERVFGEMLTHLPRNGAPGQDGLSYFVRDGNLLLVFVHTLWSKMGGEGHVETEWLESTLKDNADAQWKFVIGHHPVFAVNGFDGDYQRNIGTEYKSNFWRILRENGVFAYLCSHILAFDTQVHDGVLQITTAGAGTAHRMPEGVEYLHAVQVALDKVGLRYQVLDTEGTVRERLSWPLNLPVRDEWSPLLAGRQAAPLTGVFEAARETPAILAWNVSGQTVGKSTGQRQTFLSVCSKDGQKKPFWIGLSGENQKLTVILQPQAGRSPHYWFGAELGCGSEFEFQIAVHSGLAAGGIMFRRGDNDVWSSMLGASPWGGERIDWPETWSVGFDGKGGLPFLGQKLQVKSFVQID